MITPLPEDVSEGGTRMEIPSGFVNSSWISRVGEQTGNGLDFQYTSKDLTGRAVQILPRAVSFTENVHIQSITPEEGTNRAILHIRGIGFHSRLENNQVRIGGIKAEVFPPSTPRSLFARVPQQLEDGRYLVQLRVSGDDGRNWTDWTDDQVWYTVTKRPGGAVRIDVWDSGNWADDAFQLFLDGVDKGTMYASPGSYSRTWDGLVLEPGPHTAMLRGVNAPDGVGTYSIRITGDVDVPVKDDGIDLTPGVRKFYRFNVRETTGSKR